MSANSQFHSPGANDWVEQLRDAICHEPPPIDEAVLEAAYDAGELDTPRMFAYFEGQLSEEERREVEREVAHSPHALRKLTRIGAIIAQSRIGTVAGPGGVPLGNPPAPAKHGDRAVAAASPGVLSGRSTPDSLLVVHQIKLNQPRPSIGNTLPRSEDCLRISADSALEFYRSLEKSRDQLRIFHHSAPVGTLVRIQLLEPLAQARSSSASITQFAVLRRGSDSTTTTTLTIPLSFKRGEVCLELTEIPAGELTADDVNGLLNSYEKAAIEDPIAVTPLHEPRSAWQVWADAVRNAPANQMAPAVVEVAELIAAS